MTVKEMEAARLALGGLFTDAGEHPLTAGNTDDGIEWIWAYRQSLWLFDQFDAEGIRAAEATTNAGENIWPCVLWDRFFNTYRMTGKFHARLRSKRTKALTILAKIFKEPLTCSDKTAELTRLWCEGIKEIGPLAAPPNSEGYPRLRSLVSKILWFYQPHSMTMYDSRAANGLAHVLNKNQIDCRDFLKRFDDVFLDKKSAISLAGNFSDRAYPYPRRVLDQWLWMKGGKDRDDLIRCFRSSLKRAPIQICRAA